MKKKNRQRKAYTLIEILIAVSLFAAVGMISLGIFINVTRIQARLTLENAIYEDARFMMERISRAIRNNTIDYEEYFNKSINKENHYGELFGCYAAQFYNPGPNNSNNSLKQLGAYCNDGKLYTGQMCTVYKPSIDINTGQYPYLGATNGSDTPKDSNAFCLKYPISSTPNCTTRNDNIVEELYLINADGTNKTYFARKKVVTSPPEYVLAMLEKVGEDQNKDGIHETWNKCSDKNKFCCANRYNCTYDEMPSGQPFTLEKSLDIEKVSDIYRGFVPISPLRTTITKLSFLITPGEDPHKAFAEPNAITQPRVVITLEVKPNKKQLESIGDVDDNLIPAILLQTTVTSRVQSEVKSYIGADTHSLTSSGSKECPW